MPIIVGPDFQIVYGDAVTALRDWLRAQPAIIGTIGGDANGVTRVYGKFPQSVIYPAIRVSEVGGGQRALTDAPLESLRMAVEVVGDHDGDWATTKAASLAVKSVLQTVPAQTPVGSLLFHDVTVGPTVFAPDPDSEQHRFVTDVVLTCALAQL